MKQRCLSLMLIVVVVRLCATVEPASAQSAPSPDASQRGVLLTKLSEPTYPRLAQLARIAGDVDLNMNANIGVPTAVFFASIFSMLKSTIAPFSMSGNDVSTLFRSRSRGSAVEFSILLFFLFYFLFLLFPVSDSCNAISTRITNSEIVRT